jgi:acyl-CoA hydrolase
MTNSPRIAETLRIMEVVFPNTTNHYGTLFGGKVLDLMDRAAFLAATRFSNQAMVTASTEHIDFYVPVKAGYIVELVASKRASNCLWGFLDGITNTMSI